MTQRYQYPFGFGGRQPATRGGDPFLDLHREVNRLFDDVLRGGGQAAPQGGPTLAPRMDVSENEGEVRVCVELPGVRQEDVDVTLNNDVLTIAGEKRSEAQRERESYHLTERSFGRFQRAIQLPFAPEPDKVRAAFEHGVLTITLPKASPQQRSRRIEVQAGGQPTGAGQSGAAGQLSGQPQGAASAEGQPRQAGKHPPASAKPAD
jgi:HSP20 family protein